MTRIPSDLARFGLKVELVPGWETRGSSSFAPAAVVAHWTAGPRGTTKRPSLNICTFGRTGLPGPLANIYLARDGTCVVIAAGRANHAGTGGWRGLVGNSAAYGIEAESAGDGDWTPAMLDAYPRLIAALLHGLGRDAKWLCGHHEWAPNRKIDIRDVIGRIRADTARHLVAGPTPVTKPATPAQPPSEDFDMYAQIKPGDTVKIPVPGGRKWKINVISDSVMGQVVFGKQVSPGRAVGLFYGHAFGKGAQEWELYVGETQNLEIPCSATSFVEVTNKGRLNPAESTPIAVTLTPAT